MSRVRWGILGTGQAARKFAQGLAELPDAVLQAVGSRDPIRAGALAADFGAPCAYDGYAALVEDPEVDVVYVATPHDRHAADTLLAIAAGKPVLCEKPLTRNAAEARMVIDAARRRGVFLMEAMWTRFLPAVQQARRLVQDGEIGLARHLAADFSVPVAVGPDHRLRNPERAGGALLDIGVYPLSLGAFFLGPIESVVALGDLGATGVDEQTAFCVRHRGSAYTTGFAGFGALSPWEATLSGDLGHIRLERPLFCPSRLSVALHHRAPRLIEAPPLGNGYAHQAIEVARCLREGRLESDVLPLEESLSIIGALDAVRAQIGLRYPGE